MVSVLLLATGCGPKVETFSLDEASSSGIVVSYDALPHWKEEDHQAAKTLFEQQCSNSRLPQILLESCDGAATATDAKAFFENYFVPVLLVDEAHDEDGLMTGYYEPLLHGSRSKNGPYRFPLYAKPDDLLTVDLSSVYPQLRGMKLRGRVEGGSVVPYATREEIDSEELNSSVICYVDSDIDRFFLQVQGSGRVRVDGNETIFVGYANENGHPYRSIGKTLIERGVMAREEVSLQSIRAWLEQNPQQRQTLLYANPSFIFFGQREQGATGSLGLELTPMRSLAVDRSHIPLGMPLFYATKDPVTQEGLYRLAFAQDTGGAIKGEVRADLFWGFGEEAETKAGMMKSPLTLWMLLPRSVVNN